MTALAVVNLVLVYLAAEDPGGDGGGISTLLDGSPVWIRAAYVVVLVLGGIAGVIKAYTVLRGSGGKTAGRDHVEEFLDRADRELTELRAANDRLEAANDRLESEVAAQAAELGRSREREAGLRATIDLLRGFLDERNANRGSDA